MRFLLVMVLFVVALAGCSPAKAFCSIETCATGCCDSSGKCQAGTTVDACGTAGVACNVCVSPQACSAAQQCLVPEVDAGVADAGTDAGVEALPIAAAAETWTWVDFPDTQCGNGQPTGLGINITSRSQDLFVYLQGGGACWNAVTCFQLASAINLETGYTSNTWVIDSTWRSQNFLRGLAANPFKNSSFVMIPYCTGDVHTGDNEVVMDKGNGVMTTVHFKGRKNIEAYLRRLKATFPLVHRIFLTGSSAGAFGAQFNYPLFAAAFPDAEVHVLADSGQMVQPVDPLPADWKAAWNTGAVPGCPTCSTNYPDYAHWLITSYPTRRFALLAYTQDQTLRTFNGYTAADYETQTRALLTAQYDPNPNAKYFLLAGESHTMLGSQFTLSSPSGVTLNTFITKFVNGDTDWASVKP